MDKPKVAHSKDAVKVIGTKKVMIDGVEYDCQIVSPIDLNKKQKCRCKGTRSLNAKQIKIPVL